MKKLLVIKIMLISNLCFCQLTAVIINSETKETIPYVNIWVENENIGTTSNENGAFKLEIESPKIIVFSAIGFQTIKISSDSIQNIIELKPFITKLDEIVINSKQLIEELIIGNFKKSKINYYFSCGPNPWITARFFKYDETYGKTLFLKKIRLLTKSDVSDSKFNLRFYDINENGEPDGYIYAENIFGTAKKGKNITEIDISHLNLTFPKKGFFIAIEWLIIESNRYEYSYTVTDSNKKMEGVSYEPAFGTVPADSDENSWIYNQGKWKKVFKNKTDVVKDYKNKYNLLAIELTLTN